jgi:hypothetical protein
VFTPAFRFEGQCERARTPTLIKKNGPVGINSSKHIYQLLIAFNNSVFLARRVFLCKGKGKVVPVLNQAPHNEDVLGEWRYGSTHS